MKESHFYLLTGKLSRGNRARHTWIIHSFKNLEEFTKNAEAYAPEYEIEKVIETFFEEMEIIAHWDSTD